MGIRSIDGEWVNGPARGAEEGTGACPVLVVEDEPELRNMMLGMLRTEGFDARAASNGLDALSQVQHGPCPHVILLDLMTPVMDGWGFRDAKRHVPGAIADPGRRRQRHLVH